MAVALCRMFALAGNADTAMSASAIQRVMECFRNMVSNSFWLFVIGIFFLTPKSGTHSPRFFCSCNLAILTGVVERFTAA